MNHMNQNSISKPRLFVYRKTFINSKGTKVIFFGPQNQFLSLGGFMSYYCPAPDQLNYPARMENEGFHEDESADYVPENGCPPSSGHRGHKSRLSKSVSIDVDQSANNCYNNPFSTPSFTPTAAVSVHSAFKQYGATPILKNLNMTVKRGTIYSLLGASGCGKTTLLSCVVGLKKLSSGDIYVLGARPGTKASGVPGKRVGYMPQEIALFGEFSIEESMRYYGRIYSMTNSQIEENISFLIDFLNLPPATRRIKNLSGGQQRRVSLSCSLIHNPELLLLDEPTVGVDALLRNSIWEHLVKLVSTGKTTVIITTHYIEEARQSNTIGLMRNGKLLVEDSPNRLIRKYKTNLLEDIVMELCLKDTQSDDDVRFAALNSRGSRDYGNEVSDCSTGSSEDLPQLTQTGGGNGDDSESLSEESSKWRKLHRASVVAERRLKPERLEQLEDSWNRFSTLLYKNYATLLRNMPFLTFILFCPALQVIVVCLAIGGDPKGLEFGVLNHELPSNSTCSQYLMPGCPLNDNYTGLVSCLFVELLDKEYVNVKTYHEEEKAIDDVKDSKVLGLITFESNFTKSFKERAMFGANAELDSIYGSRIDIQMDFSNKQIGSQGKADFYFTMEALTRNISLECGIEPIKSEFPLVYERPVYGSENMSFKEYIAPSVLLGIIFFFPVSSSGLNYIAEKRLGTLDRSMVAGVTTAEFVFAYSGVQLLILCIQVALAFVFLTCVFGIQIYGSVFYAVLMAMLVGFAGISVGFLLSTICSQEIQAVLLAMGMFVPNLLMAGMIWPIEGMHEILQYIAYILPCTLACESMRSIVTRGVGMMHSKVWPGFAATTGWIILYWILLVALHKLKSRK